MIASLTDALLAWAQVVPLELFAFLGSFVEEVLAPVPSPIVMTLTGTIAATQQEPMMYLLVLSVIAALGKTLGAVIVYVISAKAENIIFGRFGWMFGVSHEEIIAFGKKLHGTWKDYVLLFTLRALPIMSSAVVSIGAGAIKVPMRVYLPTTFFGTIIRDAFYLYVGFTGVDLLFRLVNGLQSIESMIEAVIIFSIVVLFGWLWWKRRAKRSGV